MSEVSTDRLASQQFIDELDNLGGNPKQSLIFMHKSIGLDVGMYLGFRPDLALNDPEILQVSRIGIAEYGAIKVVEDTVKFLSRHATVTPQTIGMWLMTQNERFGGETPMYELFQSYRGVEPQIRSENIRKVIAAAADSFLRPDADFYSELRELMPADD